MAAVQLRRVCKTFGRTEVIRDVSVDIADGEFVVLVGPSGCGKSTLLRLIAGLEDITSGDILIDGVCVNARAPKERGVAMVFQSYALYPHMNAYENMAFGLRLARSDTATLDQKVRRAADMLELTPLLERLPRELSGGQRQRVAIGRAIVRDPKVFLFDEPLSNLDAALRVQTRIELSRLHQSTGATMVYVTHDQVEAMTLADKVVVLSQGRIEQVGPPLAVYHAPANRFVAGFIGSPRMNFIDVQVSGRTADAVSVTLPGDVRVDVPAPGDGLGEGETLTLGVRPDHLTPEAPGVGLEGVVKVVEQLGEAHLLHVQVSGAGLLTLREPGDASVTEGQSIGIALRARSCHLFREDGTAVR